MRRRCFSYLTSLIFLSLACSPVDTLPDEATAIGCSTTQDCPTGLTCQVNACVAVSGPDGTIHLTIRPPRNARAGEMDLKELVFNDGPILSLGDVILPNRVEVFGSARLGSGEVLPVWVHAVADSVDGRPIKYDGETIDDVNGSRFVLRLPAAWPLAGGTFESIVYRLKAIPKDLERFPPWRVDPLQVPVEGGALRVDLPDAQDMPVYRGMVLQSEDDPLPVSGLTVRAEDQAGRTISSLGTTDSTGRFQIFFWPGSAGMVANLKIRASSDSGPYPGLDRPIRVPELETEDASAASMQSYYLGDLPRVRWMRGSVLGNRPLAGTQLRFRGEVGDGIYRYDVVQADEQGEFSAYLFPGQYTVDIIPPMGSRYRYSRVSGVIQSEDELAFRPSRQATVTGQVFAPGGRPIPGATVESTLMKAAFNDPRLARADDVAPTRAQRVQTDLEGNYILDLDPGTHDLRIVAPTEYGLPPLTRSIDITPIDQSVSGIDIQLPAGAVVVMTLMDASRRPIKGAVVEAWADGQDRPRRLGMSRSDASGLIRLPIAASR